MRVLVEVEEKGFREWVRAVWTSLYTRGGACGLHLSDGRAGPWLLDYLVSLYPLRNALVQMSSRCCCSPLSAGSTDCSFEESNQHQHQQSH